MTVAQALNVYTARFKKAGVPEPAADAGWLLAALTALPRSALAHTQTRLTAEQENRLEAYARRREKREPLQYILGGTSFYGINIQTDPRALIPRADTEILADTALTLVTKYALSSVLEIGTGSGALALALAKHSHAAVTATDISADALALARENAHSNQVPLERLRFLEADLFAEGRFSMVVSNPPYLSEADFISPQPEITYEPRLALYGGTDGLSFYRRIFEGLPSHLEPGGFICLEAGAGQQKQLTELARLAGCTQINWREDWQYIPRVLSARWNA